MLGDDGNSDQPQQRRKYLRSASGTDRYPYPPQPHNKARACLSPLSISRENVEDWPRARSDDLGVWSNAQTPRGLVGKPAGGLLPVAQFQRQKLNFFNKECLRIVEYVYFGSNVVAQNQDLLRRNGITHVLNCVGFVPHEYFKSDLVYKTLWLQDSPFEDITSILYDICNYFEDVKEQGASPCTLFSGGHWRGGEATTYERFGEVSRWRKLPVLGVMESQLGGEENWEG